MLAHQVSGPVPVEAAASDPAWRRAFPIESFLVLGASNQLARAQTRVRLLHDETALYAAATCWTPGGRPAADADTVEVFLQTPALQDDYLHVFVSADGRLRQQYNTVTVEGGVTRKQADNNWTCPGLEQAVARDGARWSAVLKIPGAALKAKPGAGVWTINLARVCPLGSETEISAIQMPGAADLHQVSAFRRVDWTAEPYPPLTVAFEAVGFRVRTETLPQTVASVASFRLELEADRVLHGVALEAEAYDAAGKLHARRRVAAPDSIVYRWTDPAPIVLEFNEVCDRGGVRVRLTSEEGGAERWFRFGGWDGTNTTAALFAPGIAGTTGLAGVCYFPDRVKVGGREVPLLTGPAGTLEFWIKPAWPGRWLPPPSKGEVRVGGHVVVHYGPVRDDRPAIVNNSPLAVLHDAVSGVLTASLLGERHAGHVASASVRDLADWQPGRWRHVAVVWDAAAERGARVRLYLDGARRAGCVLQAADRLPPAVTNVLETVNPFPVQVGSLNTGWRPAEAVIDALRLSRAARYAADFTPEAKEPDLDPLTTARFAFNGTLAGDGMTPDRAVYAVAAVAGVSGR